MPTVSVKRDLLFESLGRAYTDDEFQELCFQFGLELDEVTTEKQMFAKEQGSGAAANFDLSEEVLYRIDIPANRYDLLCLEGLVNGLLVFQGKISPPQYELDKAEDVTSLHVTQSTAQVRPHAVAAILRNVTFTQQSYNSFIDLQDKLHQNICRKRTLVAIGTHDLDTLQGPFVYDALPPEQICFKALNQTTEMTAPQLMDLFSSHAQLKQYVGIIRDKPLYPVIRDRRGVVLSMPPIINGDHSKITLNTKNVFIECTATDVTKAEVVLDTVVCLFSRYCAAPFRVQACKVFAPDGSYQLHPALRYRQEVVSVARANTCIGVQLSAEKMAGLLRRMCLEARALSDEQLSVRVPPLRHDVIHAADVYEDIAIAYGYNNIERRACRVATEGRQQPLNQLSEQLRLECALAGYTEALTFSLCSREDISSKLGVELSSVPAVHISNPKTLEFQVARTTLLPGLLRTLAANKKMPLPLRLFEISDVVLKDPAAESGASNERRACAVHCGRAAAFQLLHGLLDRLMAQLRAPRCRETGYYIRPAQDATYLGGRCADVVWRGAVVGRLGVLHPDVLAAFDLAHPCTALEFNIQPFL